MEIASPTASIDSRRMWPVRFYQDENVQTALGR